MNRPLRKNEYKYSELKRQPNGDRHMIFSIYDCDDVNKAESDAFELLEKNGFVAIALNGDESMWEFRAILIESEE